LAQSLAFLQEKTPSGTLTKQKKPIVAERTQPHLALERDTGSNMFGKALGAVANVRRKPLVLAGIAGGLVLLLGIVLTLTLRHGTLTVEIDEQLGKDVQVAVSQGGQQVQVADAKSGWTLGLRPGEYDVAVQGGDDQFQLDPQSITVTRGEQVKVRVTLKPPPLAVAPFDEKHARKYQQAWARYLRLPVEITNSIGMKLVLIPPGEFTMGEGDGSHRVVITKPFYLGKYEMTQEEWERVMGGNPSEFKGPKNPVEQVSWGECQLCAEKLTEIEKEAGSSPKGEYRLPSEAQWEYACRAGTTSGWFFGENEQGLDDYGWYIKNSEGKTHPIGQKKPNAWGLYDVCGNVWEWCADWYDDNYYKVSPRNDPPGPTSGSARVGRGGGWSRDAGFCRSAYRSYIEPGPRRGNLGFRASLVLADTATERAKMDRTADATQPSGGSTANKPSPAVVQLPAAGSLVGADGKWNLPPGAPLPAVAPFDAAKAKEHQTAWAKHLGVPVEITNSIGMKLVLIPPGEFTMGSPKELIEEELKAHGDDQGYKERLPGEGPQHRVRITRPFYLGTYLVTQGEYEKVMGSNPSEFSVTGNGKDKVAGQDTKRFPVEWVSRDDAVEFCRKLSEMPEERAAEHTYRLPSEAQWEYACRAGNLGRYSFSMGGKAVPKEDDENGLSDYGWFGGNSSGMPHVVGGKKANAWALFDMHGNMYEWCQDWYGGKEYYTNSPADDPAGPSSTSVCVVRGGSWNYPAVNCRSAYRNFDTPGSRNSSLGFRVSRVLADK
jgi:formylglycine-generating enzyme required for sulfatase activity